MAKAERLTIISNEVKRIHQSAPKDSVRETGRRCRKKSAFRDVPLLQLMPIEHGRRVRVSIGVSSTFFPSSISETICAVILACFPKVITYPPTIPCPRYVSDMPKSGPFEAAAVIGSAFVELMNVSSHGILKEGRINHDGMFGQVLQLLK